MTYSKIAIPTGFRRVFNTITTVRDGSGVEYSRELKSPPDDIIERNTDVSVEAVSLERGPTHVPLALDKQEFTHDRVAMETTLVEVRKSLTLDFPQCREITEIMRNVRCWMLVFLAYGFRYSSIEQNTLTYQVLKTGKAACDCSLATSCMDYFKFKNASFMACNCKDQVLPPTPHPIYERGNHKYLFGGAFSKFQRSLRRISEKTHLSFCTSILQSKKGMERPSDEFVKETARKNAIVMTTVKPETTWEYHWEPLYGLSWEETSDWQDRRSVTYNRCGLEREIDRTVRELFKKWKPDLDVLTKIFLPSTSSNYNRTRKRFGTYGELEELPVFQEFKGDIVKGLSPEEAADPNTWISFKYRMTKLTNYVSEYYGPEGTKDFEENRDNVLEVVGGQYDCQRFLAAWRKFYWRCVHLALGEKPLVEVVGLKEALKVRCISKGPPLTYFVLKPIQKSLWQELQKTWNFELTGTPITEELMNLRFKSFVNKSSLHSGDYKAATDELHSWCSERACDSVFRVAEANLGYSLGPLEVLTKRALTGHVYVLEDGQEKEQERGQLMGSIVSFPFLCILNATLIRRTYELSENVCKLIRDCPFWINGDDCLTAYGRGNRFPEIWRGLGSVMGFSESVGKTYDSDYFCSINSTTFVVVEDHWELVPYVNLGLYFGMDRSMSGTRTKVTDPATKAENAAPTRKRAVTKPKKNEQKGNLVQLGTWQTEFLATGPQDQLTRERLDYLFCQQHKEDLSTFPGQWHLPVWCGGLGLTPPISYNEKDCFEAGLVRLMIGLGFDVPTLPKEKEWVHFDKFNRQVRKDLPLVSKYSYEHYDGEETYGTVFGALVWKEFLAGGVKSLYDPTSCNFNVCLKEINLFRRVKSMFINEVVKPTGMVIKKCTNEEISSELKRTVFPIFEISVDI